MPQPAAFLPARQLPKDRQDLIEQRGSRRAFRPRDDSPRDGHPHRRQRFARAPRSSVKPRPSISGVGDAPSPMLRKCCLLRGGFRLGTALLARRAGTAIASPQRQRLEKWQTRRNLLDASWGQRASYTLTGVERAACGAQQAQWRALGAFRGLGLVRPRGTPRAGLSGRRKYRVYGRVGGERHDSGYHC